MQESVLRCPLNLIIKILRCCSVNVTKHYSIFGRVSSLKSSRYTVNPNFYRIFQRRSAFVLSCKHTYSFTFRCRNVRSLTSFRKITWYSSSSAFRYLSNRSLVYLSSSRQNQLNSVIRFCDPTTNFIGSGSSNDDFIDVLKRVWTDVELRWRETRIAWR